MTYVELRGKHVIITSGLAGLFTAAWARAGTDEFAATARKLTPGIEQDVTGLIDFWAGTYGRVYYADTGDPSVGPQTPNSEWDRLRRPQMGSLYGSVSVGFVSQNVVERIDSVRMRTSVAAVECS